MSSHRFSLPLIVTVLFIALHHPLLSIANVPRLYKGIPVLFLYIFFCWIVGIALMWRASLPKKERR